MPRSKISKTHRQALESIRERSLAATESPHEFFKWALREAKRALPSCTVLFVRLEQFSPVFRPLDARPDPWVDKLVAAVKQSIRSSGYYAFQGFGKSSQVEDDICSSQVVAVNALSAPAGSLIAVTRCPSELEEADRLFIFAIGQTFENVLERAELQTLSRTVPAVIRAKQQWERVIDSLGRFVCLLDAAGKTVRVNRRIEEWQLGTVRSAVGRSMHELFHPACSDKACDLRAAIGRGWMQMLEEGESAWEADLPEVSGNTLRFRLRRSNKHDDIDTLGGRTSHDANAFALLTVRPYLRRVAAPATPETLTRQAAADATENERRRIALELHDGIGQSLAVVKFSLESLQREIAEVLDRQAVGQMARVLADLRASMEDIHRLSADLHPRYLESRSLPDALQLLCEDLACTYSGVVLDCDVAGVAHDIPDQFKLAVFRVAQEALNNALNHSGANTIRLSLRQNAGALTLEVADDGRGFDVDRMLANGRGQGLANMRDRVRQSDGSISIRAAPSRGSTVTAIWPHGLRRTA